MERDEGKTKKKKKREGSKKKERELKEKGCERGIRIRLPEIEDFYTVDMHCVFSVVPIVVSIRTFTYMSKSIPHTHIYPRTLVAQMRSPWQQ